MTRSRTTFTVALTVLAALAAGCPPALAQLRAGAYPERPLRFVVGLAPGGATDIVARLIGQPLTEALGQQIVVDNRSGAAGSIAAAIVAKATPDGYTLHFVSSSFAINPSLYDLPFDSMRDFAPAILIAQAPFLLVTTLNAAIDRIVHSPKVADRLMRGGAEPAGGSAADFAAHLADEIARFGRLAKEIGLRKATKH